ncbi:peptidylprolyl isomerase, partial [Rodentibacter pneumotropicus]
RQKAYEKIVNSQLQDATKDWVKALRKTADIQYFNQ